MVSKTYLDSFIPAGAKVEECTKCGICLQNCPVMKMEPEEAREEITRLLNGEESKRVLKECTFCFTCNHYCPNGLKPYNLIMERIVEYNRKHKRQLPPWVVYMINGKNEAGFFNEQYEMASDEQKAVIKRWSEIPPKSQDVLFIGCYGRTVPFSIERAKALQILHKFGPRDICCGDIAYRFGDYQSFSEMAEKAFNRLSLLKADRLVCYCASCAHYFGRIWPECHGLELPFEIITLHEWLWEQYQQGNLQIQKRMEQDVVISDSCHAGGLGEHFMNVVRELYEAAGRNVVELENNKYDSLCCGVGSLLRSDSQTGVNEDTQRKLKQILATGIADVCFDCHGCVASLGPAVMGTNLKLHYAIDDLLEAFGGAAE